MKKITALTLARCFTGLILAAVVAAAAATFSRQAAAQALPYTPPAFGAYLTADSINFTPWTAAAAFGAVPIPPTPIALYCQATAGSQWTPCTPGGGGGGGGSVTTFSAGNLAPLFTSSVANPTTTPALTFSLTNQAAGTAFLGPATGPNAAPSFRALVGTDLPLATASQFGAIKPDGTSCTVTAGVLTCPGSGGGGGTGAQYSPAYFSATNTVGGVTPFSGPVIASTTGAPTGPTGTCSGHSTAVDSTGQCFPISPIGTTGQVPFYPGSGLAAVPQTISGDCTATSTGVFSCFTAPPSIKTGNYTLLSTDKARLVIINCATACTVTLPSGLPSGFGTSIISEGTALATLALASGTYNGSSTVGVLSAGQQMTNVYTDGTNWFGDNWDTLGARVVAGVGYTRYYPGASIDARVVACQADALAGTNGLYSHACSSFGEPDTIHYTAATATSFSIDSSNNVTVVGTNSLAAGMPVVIQGMVTGTYLNGVLFTVSSATSSQVVLATSAFTHAAVTSTTDSGTFAQVDTPHMILHQITLGNVANNPSTWFVPPGGQWDVNMSGGTDNWIFEYQSATAVGSGIVNHNLRILENTSVANGALSCFNVQGVVGNSGYYAMSGFSFNDRNFTQNILAGQCVTIGGEDNSRWDNFAVNEYGQNKHAFRPGNSGPCCSQIVTNMNLYGNDLSSDVFYVSAAGNGPEEFMCLNCSIGHPGPGAANIAITDTGGANGPITKLLFVNTYMELNNTSLTNYAVNIDGAASVIFDGPSLSFIGSGTKPTNALIHISNRFPTSFSLRALERVHGQAPSLPTIANDNEPFVIPTDAAGFINQYNSNVSYFSKFVAMSSFQLGQGTAIASASTIAPNSPVQHVTGTTTINTITPPTGCTTANQSCVQELIMDGGASITTAGNVATAINPTVGSLVFLNYDVANSKWVTPGVTSTGAGLGANTFTGAQTITAAGAASAPSLTDTGAVYTAGTTTTAVPLVFFGQPGATNWVAGGAEFGLDPTTGANVYQMNYNHSLVSSLSSAGFLFAQSMGGNTYEAISTGGYRFSSTGSSSGAVDTGLYRLGVGAAEIANGTGANGLGTLTLAQVLPGVLYSAAGTAIPTCAVGLKGATAIVNDATSPTYMGAYTSGGGITAAVICSFNGTTYAWLTH